MIKTSKLTKDYGGGRGAIDIDIELGEGEIVGFIGPNGAGKTTTLDMLVGFIIPDYGAISIFDKEMNGRNDWVSVLSRIGFLPGEVTYHEDLSAAALLSYTNSFQKDNHAPNFRKMAKIIDLDLKSPVKKLSQGNKRKLGVINSLFFEPDLVIMDEPTSGLDPLVQQEVLEMIQDVKKRGGSVLLSSHNLTEVQRICDRVIMIKDGKIIIKDTKENILSKTVDVFRLIDGNFTDKVSKLEYVKDFREEGEELVVMTSDKKKFIDFLLENKMYDYFIERPTLENMFLEYYKHES